jgi:phosphatidylserine decarboxylase
VRTLLIGGALTVGTTAAFLQFSRHQLASPSSKFEPGDWTAYFPTRTLSRAWGAFSRTEMPQPLETQFLKGYAWLFGCNVDEATRPIESYPSLAAFFTRELKEGARPIDPLAPVVVPADSKMMVCGSIRSERDEDDLVVEQVKGITYSMKALLGRESSIPIVPQNDMYYAVFYLAPGDYHGFHAPTPASYTKRIHIHGQLLPVWSAFVESIKGLFVLNERIVLEGKWEHGYMGYVAVGATNVGSIAMRCDPQLKTNVGRHFHFVRRYEKENEVDDVDEAPIDFPVKKGENVGFFHLGSTIVMVWEAPRGWEFKTQAGQRVKMGEALLAPAAPQKIGS